MKTAFNPAPRALPSAANSVAYNDFLTAQAAHARAVKGEYTPEEVAVYSAVMTGYFWTWQAAQAADEIKAADLRHTAALQALHTAEPVYVAFKLSGHTLEMYHLDYTGAPHPFAHPQEARQAIEGMKPHFISKYNEVPLFALTTHASAETALEHMAETEAAMTLDALYNANPQDLPELRDTAAAHILAAEYNENMEATEHRLTIRRAA